MEASPHCVGLHHLLPSHAHPTPPCAALLPGCSRSGVELQHAVLRIAVGGMPLLHHGHPTELASSAAAYCSEYMHAQIGRCGSGGQAGAPGQTRVPEARPPAFAIQRLLLQ